MSARGDREMFRRRLRLVEGTTLAAVDVVPGLATAFVATRLEVSVVAVDTLDGVAHLLGEVKW